MLQQEEVERKLFSHPDRSFKIFALYQTVSDAEIQKILIFIKYEKMNNFPTQNIPCFNNLKLKKNNAITGLSFK